MANEVTLFVDMSIAPADWRSQLERHITWFEMTAKYKTKHFQLTGCEGKIETALKELDFVSISVGGEDE
ncbi:hypothetical protein [Maritalea porphyrae]|uniref:hypothetical protein n=1 Tax=Maritalea porphyrae TaxID=880732 RepID=UPI0022B03E64|nr:hypothetical protein [Maritalea porphyrae]MCZ4274009.1 hypothetical protein [Maritalea porphyrae]